MVGVDTRQGYDPTTGTYLVRDPGTYLVSFTLVWRPSSASRGDWYACAVAKNSANVASKEHQYNFDTGNYENWSSVSCS